MKPGAVDETIASQPPPARTFAGGRYVVLRTLGEGGQKLVHLVQDTALDRQSALALIRKDGVSSDDLARLRREARAMAQMGGHSHIVAVYDIAEEDGQTFVVSEYLPGGDVRREIDAADGPLPLARALSIATDVCRALAFAHARGIVHRDVKPANVWLTESGAAKLGDFGLALAGGAGRLTAEGAIVGTPLYLAPELGSGGEVDGRTDLYALGCMLHELLTGRPPFVGDTAMALLYQHLHVPPPPASHANPAVPRALERLVLRLLSKTREERPASADEVLTELARAATEPAEAPPPRAAESTPFVGRREELAELTRALDAARGGRGSLHVVTGEPGVGKSRLARELCEVARSRGARVLVGRCTEAEGSAPFLPFAEALEEVVAQDGIEAMRARVASDASLVGRLLPALRAEGSKTTDDRRAFFHAISRLLETIATSSGAVLVIEDAQWADQPSLLLLTHLARQLASTRLLVLALYRDLEVGRRHPLAEALADLRRDHLYERTVLHRLPPADVRALIGQGDPAAVPDALFDAILAETDGNPFFVGEVVRHLADEGRIRREDGRWSVEGSVQSLSIPEGVREVVGRRIARLSDACAKMLSAASVLRGPCHWEVVVALTGEDEEKLLDLLDEALGAQLLRERRDEGSVEYEFTHALVRQALEGDLSSPRRARLHRSAGEAIARVYGAELGPHVADVAHHFHQAGDAAKVAEYGPRAAARAMEALAYEEAALQSERVLAALDRLPPDDRARAEARIALGIARIRAGAREAGQESCLEAAKLARAIGDATLLARAGLGYGIEFNPGFVDGRLVDLLQEAERSLPESEAALRARVMARLAGAMQPSFNPDEPLRIARDAIVLARKIGDEPTLLDVLNGACSALVDYAEPSERKPLHLEQVALATRLGAKVEALRGRLRAVFDFLELGELAGADEQIDAYDALAREVGQPQYLWPAHVFRSMRAMMSGRFAESEAWIAETQKAGEQGGDPRAGRCLAYHRVGLYRAWERHDALEAAGEAFVAANPEVWRWVSRISVDTNLLARRGDLAGAREMLSQIEPSAVAFGGAIVWFAEAIALACDVRFAAELERRVDAKRRRWITWGPTGVICEGPLARYLGLFAVMSKRWDDAERHTAAALAELDAAGMRPYAARCRYDFAHALLGRDAPGDRERAKRLLGEVAEEATALGMPGLLEGIARTAT